MGSVRFDSIAKLLASDRTAHDQVVRWQSPDASPIAVSPPKDFLFVQSFQSGSIEPKDDDGDVYTLTVDHGLGQTLYFSDRPERIVGAAPTPQFLDGLGFSLDNPPNAALVVDTDGGESDIVVVELFNPTYDPAMQVISYDLVNLAASEDAGLQEATTDLSALAPDFGSAHLFIDDCPDASIACFGFADDTVQGIAGTGGMCWSWSSFVCWWCDQAAVDQLCNTTFPACVNRCHAAPLPT